MLQISPTKNGVYCLKKLAKNIGEKLRSGDRAAFGQLYDRYASALYGMVLRMVKDENVAKDILQESFIKIWKNASSYNSQKANIFTWMYQVTRNTALDKLRQLKNRGEKEIQIKDSNLYNIGISGVNPDTVDLPEVLHQIDEKYRRVIGALFYGGMTQKEASNHLNLPLGTVKTRLKIGLRELRKIFKDPLILTAFSAGFANIFL